MSARNPVALVTGASSGIGLELARLFARKGHRLMIVARRADRLDALAGAIERDGHARPLVAAIDLEQPDAGDRIDAALTENNAEPQFVVNNAGFGLVGLASTLQRREQLAMIDLNVRTLTDFSLRWAESMERHRGGLLNVASVGGFLPGPRSAVYYASKAYVVSFTEALHREWAARGIRVTALCPGPVPTGFQARAGVPDSGRDGLASVSASRVAEAGYDGLMTGRRLVVPGIANKVFVSLTAIAPRALLLALADRRQRSRLR